MAAPKAPAGHFTILYFAAAFSVTKRQYEHLPAPMKVACLFDELEMRYPGIKEKVLDGSAVTVNLDYVDIDELGNDTIKERDEVAIIPPVSSG